MEETARSPEGTSSPGALGAADTLKRREPGIQGRIEEKEPEVSSVKPVVPRAKAETSEAQGRPLAGKEIGRPSAPCRDSDERFQQAMRLRNADQRLERLLDLTGACPDHSEALYHIALIYSERDEQERAISFYKRSLESDPDFPYPYVELGDLYLSDGRNASAYKVYTEFLKLSSKHGTLVHYPDVSDYVPYVKKKVEWCENNLQVPSRSLVPAQEIEKRLTESVAVKTRGLEIRKVQPRIALQILFEFDSAEISQSSLRQVEEIAKALRSKKLTTSQIVVEGHTDGVGTADYNLDLSKRRAQSVANCLIRSFGIERTRLVVRYFGEGMPIASNDTQEGRALNRRVELVNAGESRAK